MVSVLRDFYNMVERMMRVIALVIFCGLAFSSTAIAEEGRPEEAAVTSGRPAAFSDALIVVPEAEQVEYLELYGGQEQLSYRVEVDYPAESVLTLISEQLMGKGWKPLEEDYVNPGLPSAHVRGWSTFEDATTKPVTKVHQWLAQWENEERDIAWYTLCYRYRLGEKPDLSFVEVVGLYIPSDIAKAMKRESERASE